MMILTHHLESFQQSLEEHRITVVEDVNQDTVGPDDGLMVKNRSGNEEEGGRELGSPISLKMASWTQTLTSETLSSQIRLSADQRIFHLPHLMIEKPSDPIRHSQQITPEAGSSSSRMTSSHSEAYFGQTSSSVSEPTQGSDRDSSADTLTSVYKDRNTLDPSSASTKPPSHLFLTPTHHQSLPINLNLTPARRFLKRPGPIPHSQPLSSKLLQSILSAPELRTQSSFSVRQELGCHPSDDPHLQFLERVCPGRCPIEIYSLSDHEPLPILSSHITLHPPILSLSDSVSCPSINSSLSSFMTDS